MKKKLLFSILGVVAISAITFGTTYAYYLASTTGTVSGETYELNTKLSLSTVYQATSLVPLNDDLITTAITQSSNKCIDKSGYEVCSLYTATLTNTGTSETLYGYIRTASSTYTTDNLKYQVFDSSYNALTDVMTLSKTADTYVYFKQDALDYSITSAGTNTYYLAIWLTDTGANQSADYSKTFNGYLGFEALGTDTGKLEAEITT